MPQEIEEIIFPCVTLVLCRHRKTLCSRGEASIQDEIDLTKR
jgi:hypothetical protein